MAAVKHFVWTDNEEGRVERGKVTVRIEDGDIWFYRVSGDAPYAKMYAWGEALYDAFPDVFTGEQKHSPRPWHVEVRGGAGASVTYSLRELANTPVLARLEVSADWKLEDFCMRLEYFKAILQYVLIVTIDARGNLHIICESEENE